VLKFFLEIFAHLSIARRRTTNMFCCQNVKTRTSVSREERNGQSRLCRETDTGARQKLCTYTEPYARSSLVDANQNVTSLCSAFYGGWKRDTARICCRPPCCCGAPAADALCSNRSTPHARRAHSSKPAPRCCSGR